MSNVLVGKVVTAIYLADDKEAIKFDIKGAEPVVVRVDADCCSHTWVENIELPALGFPAAVVSVDNLDMNKEPVETDGDYVQFYGCKIVTDRGELIIDYRNSSNGYYGGNLSWPDDTSFYGGVFGQNVSKEEWKKLA
jgi:hypothetical protein